MVHGWHFGQADVKSGTVTLLLADLLWAMQWFNPAMKLLHSEIELIHEYEADRAVLESGTDATQYKLMLVGAVAQSKGISMGNWLRNTKLKNRIDMMDKKESEKWNMLRALFIPVVATAFLFESSVVRHLLDGVKEVRIGSISYRSGVLTVKGDEGKLIPDGDYKVRFQSAGFVELAGPKTLEYHARRMGENTIQLTGVNTSDFIYIELPE